MDESFTAYLEQVQRQRAELGESMAALEAALTLPAGAGPVWRRRVRAALTELAHDLRDHADAHRGRRWALRRHRADGAAADPRCRGAAR